MRQIMTELNTESVCGPEWGYDYLDSKSFSMYMPYQFEIDITIFVPCYNEEGNIVDTLNTIFSALDETRLAYEILIIDDASKDNTKKVIHDYIKDHPSRNIVLRVRKENIGLAQNYIDCAFMAKGRYYKLVSGDNAEPKETLLATFNSLGKAEMIIPYIARVEGRSSARSFISWAYTAIVNTITGYKIKYYNGGATHYTCNVMRWHTDYHGYSFQADVITRLLDQGMNYIQIPVSYQERKTGKSAALKLKNFLSVGHFFMDLIIRRVGRKSRHYL